MHHGWYQCLQLLHRRANASSAASPSPVGPSSLSPQIAQAVSSLVASASPPPPSCIMFSTGPSTTATTKHTEHAAGRRPERARPYLLATTECAGDPPVFFFFTPSSNLIAPRFLLGSSNALVPVSCRSVDGARGTYSVR